MKRNILISLSLVFISALSYAGPITRWQAAAKANAFVCGEPMMKSSQIIMSRADDNVVEPYYIFNIGADEGFVIMSGDDAAYPVLGYSDRGHIDMSEIPDNMKAWLNGYAAALKELQQKNLPSRKETKYAAARKPVKPLLTCQWDQNYPYNKQCPRYNREYDPRPTGCVATAMAQVMYYYKWPVAKTSAIKSYTFEDLKSLGGDGSHKTLPELKPTVFEWQLMTDTYGVNSSTASEDAVAKLMRYVGQSVEMTYGVDASGAYSEAISPALTDCFGYDTTARIIYRGKYNFQPEWNTVIYNEISEGRPVLYSGDTKDEAGHQFVCDGYDKDEFFHINWGWGGVSDGYFKLHILDPFEQGTGGAGTGMAFSENQSAVIGIQPMLDKEGLSVKKTEAYAGSEQKVQIAFNNKRDDYTSMQFDLLLPQGVSISTDKAGSADVSFNQARSKDASHKVDVSRISEGKYRFVIYSPANSPFTSNEGELLNMNLKFAPNIAAGNYAGSIQNIVLCTESLGEIDLPDCEFALNIIENKYKSGDVNHDDKINDADVNALCDYVLGLEPETFDASLADIDADGDVTIADIMLAEDMVRVANNENRYLLHTNKNYNDNVSLKKSDGGIGLSLTNTTCYKAMQFDLHLPSDIALLRESLSDIRLGGFTVRKSVMHDGSIRYLIYAQDSQNIQMKEGRMVEFITDKAAAEASVTNIVMVTSYLEKMNLKDASYTVPAGIEDATADEVKTMLYTVGGVKADRSGAMSRKGIYIEKGKKILVR